MSIPLLLERTTPGMGPKVPLRCAFGWVIVEGLTEPDIVAVWCNGISVFVTGENGKHQLLQPLEKASIAQGEFRGNNSRINVRLEP